MNVQFQPGQRVFVYAGPAYGRVHVVESTKDGRYVVVRLPNDSKTLAVPYCDCELEGGPRWRATDGTKGTEVDGKAVVV